MNQWKEICNKQKLRLECAIKIAEKTLKLSDLPHAKVSSSHIEHLNSSLVDARKKYRRLAAAEFHIAVVGLEKAGKSTFVNAWIEYDLLPNDIKRCTFTTTRLHSTAVNEKQRMRIVFKGKEQFELYKNELKITCDKYQDDPNNPAHGDFKMITANRETLSEYIGKEPEDIDFDGIIEIEEKLKKFVANPKYAHAIQEVDLHLKDIFNVEGIVFYDVPGLDSGLRKHLDEAKTMLEECDAVIILKKFNVPSLSAYEQQLIEYIKKGDPYIQIADKAFVFLSRIDEAPNYHNLEKCITQSKDVWFTQCGVKGNAIVEGTSFWHLALKQRLNTENQKDLKPEPEIKSHLAKLKHFNIESQNEDAFIEACGINRIKATIFDYLSTNRAHQLEDVCAKIYESILNTSKTILLEAREELPDNPEEDHIINIGEILRKWWKAEWEKIIHELISDHSQEERLQSILDDISKIYTDKFSNRLTKLNTTKQANREIYFNTLKSKYQNNPGALNTHWRRDKIYPELNTLIEEIAKGLSTNLFEHLDSYIKTIDKRLWDNCLDVRKQVYHSIGYKQTNYSVYLDHSVRALYLRFARSVIDALIKTPLHEGREKQLDKIQADLLSIGNYFPKGSEEAYKSILKYGKIGRALLKNQNIRKENNVAGEIDPSTKNNNFMSERANTEKDVIDEVESDIKALNFYLGSIVFHISGIEAFAQQEFNRFTDAFHDLQDTLYDILRHKYTVADPRLMTILPPELKSINNTQVREFAQQMDDVQKAINDQCSRDN